MSEYWRIAVEAPIREPLTYLIPPDLASGAQPGLKVEVPLGKRAASGVLLGQVTAPDFETKSIRSIESEFPPLPQPTLRWLEWISHYYLHPSGLVFNLAYPPLKKIEKARKSNRAPVVPEVPQQAKPKLTSEQSSVVQALESHQEFGVHLIFGVTGSGKTEVYLQVLERVLTQGKSGLFLVPEISLTPQMIQRFSARFPNQVAVLHSQLTDRERTNQWWDLINGTKKILVGARSALFCPLPNIGVIIVDEEHEPSFKQEEKLKYHGRDCAIMLGKFHNCPVLLGSATPSLETWSHAQSGKYHLHRLTKRVSDRQLPQIQVIDLREEDSQKDPEIPKWLSVPLYKALQETLDEKKQSALFLNRRGLAPLVLCEDCGYIHECPNCDISLTLHHGSHLICHYCDYHENFNDNCPSCREGQMKALGLGTEQIELDLKRLFPDSRVARADRDEIQNRFELEDLISKMENHEIDFLVGTQMIAKGLDFPKLQTVGLVLADVGFNLPDFRAPERSFQVITQMSGRAGRHTLAGDKPGQVYIQTYNPDHPSLLAALQHDFEGFAQQELQARSELHYPPFGRLASFRIQSLHRTRAHQTSQTLLDRAERLREMNKAYHDIEILGPSEAPLAKIRNQFRFQMLLKSKNSQQLNRFCFQIMGDEAWIPSGVRVGIDVDPLHLL